MNHKTVAQSDNAFLEFKFIPTEIDIANCGQTEFRFSNRAGTV